MNITFLLPFNSINGGPRVVATYARKLTERGHVVTVLSQPFDGRVPPKDRIKRLLGRATIERVPPPRSPFLDFLGDRHRVLDRPGPPRPSDVPDADVIVATWWETAEWVAALPAAKGRKFYLIQGYEVFSPQTAARVIATYGLPLRKIAVSDYVRGEIAARHGVEDITVVPNAIDTEQFQTPPRSRNDALTVGFLYSATPVKRAWLAIEALTRAKARLPGLRALMFGADPVTPDLALPDWVHFEQSPAQDRIPALYAACDLWLFTSDNEGFGLPILEAMACRTPVLATSAGAAPQIIDGTNGVLLPADADAFADEIARFAQMPDADWQGWSAAAHRTATGYSWDDATDRLLALLQADPAASRTDPGRSPASA